MQQETHTAANISLGRRSRTVAQDSTDWIPWSGGECPVSPDTIVDAKFDDAVEVGGISARFWTGDETPDDPNSWKRGNTAGYNIIAYRVVQA